MTTLPRVTIIGHATIDDIECGDGAWLPNTPGGAAIYAAIGALMAGARVRLVTEAGEDYPLDSLSRNLCTARLDLRGVAHRPGPSIHNEIRYSRDNERRIEVADWRRMDELTPTVASLPADLGAGEVVLLSPVALTIQLSLLDALRRLGCRVVVDSEVHYFQRAEQHELLHRVMSAATAFLPSVEHLRALFDDPAENVSHLVPRLLALGCGSIVVKQGAAGSLAVDASSRQCWHIPAVSGLAVRETTGAGDAFDGGFAAALAAGESMLAAVCRGTVSASFAVEHAGATLPPHWTPGLAEKRYTEVWNGIREG